MFVAVWVQFRRENSEVSKNMLFNHVLLTMYLIQVGDGITVLCGKLLKNLINLRDLINVLGGKSYNMLMILRG